MSLQMSPTCPILCNQGNLIDRFQNVLMLGFCFKLSEILTLRLHIAMELFQAILVILVCKASQKCLAMSCNGELCE